MSKYDFVNARNRMFDSSNSRNVFGKKKEVCYRFQNSETNENRNNGNIVKIKLKCFIQIHINLSTTYIFSLVTDLINHFFNLCKINLVSSDLVQSNVDFL